MKTSMGTPLGLRHSGEIDGHCAAGEVKRELGCAAGPCPGAHSLPCQSSVPGGGVFCFGSIPSHHGWPSLVWATLVKIEFLASESIALGFVSRFVPGATPK